MMRAIIATAAALTLTACAAGPSLVEPGRYAGAESYTIALDREWTLMPAGVDRRVTVDYLTVDGPLLNMVFVAGGIEDGEGIVRERNEEQPVPAFRSGMSELELAEFVADSLAALEFHDVETADIRPQDLAGTPGVRMDLAATLESGLVIRGTALAAASDGALDLILFVAPGEHYYEAYADDVEAIMRSAARSAA
ncbi:hypothetical protein DDZ18_10860 [Marinicauda salina]|uniref:Lipoprotein n=1 Tax=Marinicauda salina TaxID=2135793 RepID=A0A2U2BRS9_9PROT|nr:hypothetical protein [Marinicauda salina]PWE16702.1 hypothetical protein DDZ18_10860 [Marinicauda salina]